MSSSTPARPPAPAPAPQLGAWLDAVAEIAGAVSGDEPVADLLDRVARTACTLLGYDFCGVFLPDEAGTALVIAGHHGLSADYVAQVNAEQPILLDVRGSDEAPTSVAFRTGGVVALEDIDLEPGFGPWGGVAQEQGYRALVSVPLLRGGEPVGTLNGYRRTPHRFDDAEVGLVTTLATQVAIALATARLRARERATIDELRRAEEIHGELTAASLRGEGVRGVAATLAGLLGREVVIEDVRADDRPGDRDRDRALARGEVVEVAGAAGPGAEGVEGEEAGASGPVVLAGVVLDGEVVARIAVPAERAALTGLDVRALQHAGTVTALELLRERTATEVEERLRGSLVADVLAAGDRPAGPVLERARRMGWDLAAPHLLVAFREVGAASGAGGDRGLVLARRLAGATDARPLVADHRGDVVALWPDRGPAARAAALALVDRVAAAARDSGTALAAVVSSPGDVDALPATYRVVRGALDLAASSGRAAVVDLDVAGIDQLLLRLDDPALLREYVGRVLGPALDYDRARSTGLVPTVALLLEVDLDRRAAAARLHVHPNTVLQRTRRFEELTGLRLGRPRDLLQVSAAVTVARIAGLA